MQSVTVSQLPEHDREWGSKEGIEKNERGSWKEIPRRVSRRRHPARTKLAIQAETWLCSG